MTEVVYQNFCVLCKTDEGKYDLATRTIFHTRKEADDYAETISPDRKPHVIETIPTSVKYDKM